MMENIIKDAKIMMGVDFVGQSTWIILSAFYINGTVKIISSVCVDKMIKIDHE